MNMRIAVMFTLALSMAPVRVIAQGVANNTVPASSTAVSQTGATITPRVKPSASDDAASILDRRADLRMDLTEVRIPVTVTLQQSGKLVTGLEVTNFELFEDKVRQEILSFTSEDAPISVGIVFDTSGSMGPKITKARQAVSQFMQTANLEDEFFLVQFSDRTQLTVPFTNETEDILNRLAFAQSKGSTALLDGVYLAMNEMKKAKNGRKAILIISDGGDNSSRYTESEVKNAVREADVQIYAIGIFEPFGAMGRSVEEMSGPGLLGEITEQTGGRHFAVQNLGELPDVAEKIGLELRNEYVLGYRPKNDARDGKYRKVEVKLVNTKDLPRLRSRARGGYYAPEH
ncbi:MAG: VWA domain-containing protein [Acidobacteriota bacterium]